MQRQFCKMQTLIACTTTKLCVLGCYMKLKFAFYKMSVAFYKNRRCNLQTVVLHFHCKMQRKCKPVFFVIVIWSTSLVRLYCSYSFISFGTSCVATQSHTLCDWSCEHLTCTICMFSITFRMSCQFPSPFASTRLVHVPTDSQQFN